MWLTMFSTPAVRNRDLLTLWVAGTVSSNPVDEFFPVSITFITCMCYQCSAELEVDLLQFLNFSFYVTCFFLYFVLWIPAASVSPDTQPYLFNSGILLDLPCFPSLFQDQKPFPRRSAGAVRGFIHCSYPSNHHPLSNIQYFRSQYFIYFMFLFVWDKRENSILSWSGSPSMTFNPVLPPCSSY